MDQPHFLKKLKFSVLIVFYFLTTLIWTRRTISKAHPLICLTDMLLVTTTFMLLIWLV